MHQLFILINCRQAYNFIENCLMKRKQFLNRLIKITQQQQLLKSNQTSKSRQDKYTNHNQPIISKLIPIEALSQYIDYNPIKSRDNSSIKHELPSQNMFIQGHGNTNISYRRISSNRRMRTAPTHSAMEGLHVEQQTKPHEQIQNACLYDEAQHKGTFISTDMNLVEALPHYLQIKEMQPRTPAHKLLKQNSKRAKKLSQKPKQTNFKRYSLTEPSETAAKRAITSSGPDQQLFRDNQSNRSQYMRHSSLNRQKYHNSNKAKLQMRKQINKNYNRHFNPPPRLTAKSYLIYQVKQTKEQSKVITSFNSKTAQEVASLTKIMTCVLILEICKELGIDRNVEEVTIGKLESNVGGTTACLAFGEIYTIQQLLLGLMLPSGNDASMALAIWGGRHLFQREHSLIEIKHTKMQCYNRFIQEMNTKAKLLQMNKTNYANSHGLINPNNKSTAFDIALLCQYAMSNQSFRKIVQCQRYKGAVRFSEQYKNNQQALYLRQGEQVANQNDQFDPKSISPYKSAGRLGQKRIGVEWENTHKLVHLRPKEYLGIKTGYTTSAGPCLSSFISIDGRNFIIIVLGCGRVSLRFKETDMLRRWLIKHESLKKKRVKLSINRLTEQQQELQESQVQFLLENMKVDQSKED